MSLGGGRINLWHSFWESDAYRLMPSSLRVLPLWLASHARYSDGSVGCVVCGDLPARRGEWVGSMRDLRLVFGVRYAVLLAAVETLIRIDYLGPKRTVCAHKIAFEVRGYDRANPHSSKRGRVNAVTGDVLTASPETCEPGNRERVNAVTGRCERGHELSERGAHVTLITDLPSNHLETRAPNTSATSKATIARIVRAHAQLRSLPEAELQNGYEQSIASIASALASHGFKLEDLAVELERLSTLTDPPADAVRAFREIAGTRVAKWSAPAYGQEPWCVRFVSSMRPIATVTELPRKSRMPEGFGV